MTHETRLLESALLKAMSVRKNYDTFAHLIDNKRLLPNTQLLLKDYEKYYGESKHNEIDWGMFTTSFTQHWHNTDLDDNEIEYYRDSVIPLIKDTDPQDVNAVIVGLLDREYREKFTNLVSSDINPDLVSETIDNYKLERAKYIQSEDEESFTIDKVDFSTLDKSKGIPWFLPSVQSGLGSLVRGQFVVVAADYGVGKSAFVISQAAESFKYLHKTKSDRPILYFNSEGTTADVFCRFLSCLYSKHIKGGFEEVLERIEEVQTKFVETFNSHNFMVFQIQQGNMSKIKQKIDKYNPSIVIIDIADVLAKEEDVQNLKKLFDGLRLISAESCPIIATTQSGDTSYKYFDKETNKMVTKHRRWLSEKDLYGSKAGKGGAADTIITIGKDDDMPNIRYVHTPKKKRGTIVSATCEIAERFSLYKEII